MKSDFLYFAEPEDYIKLVAFYVGDVRYGIDIMRIAEIINPGELVRVPAMPGHIIGMVDHRGAVMPVLDLRLKFGLERAEVNKRTKWILIKVGGRDFGLQVDCVTSVLKLSQSQLRQKPSVEDEKDAAWIVDVFAADDGLVFQLDLDTLTRGASARDQGTDPKDGGK